MRDNDLLSQLARFARPQAPCGNPKSEPEAAFPNMALSHGIRISATSEWSVLAALAVGMNTYGGRLDHLSFRRIDDVSVVMCRVSGLTASHAEAAVRQLGELHGVYSVNIEHILSKF